MTKRLLSVLVALLMLVSVLSVAAYAEDEGMDFTIETSFSITGNMSLSALSVGDIGGVGVTVKVDESKIGALDDGSTDYTVTTLSIEAVEERENGKRYDFLTDPDGFKTVFGEKTPLDPYGEPVVDPETGENVVAEFNGTTVFATVTLHFASKKAFGTLNYTATLNGFAAPPELPIPGVDLSAVALPTTVECTGTVADFPTIDSLDIPETTVRQTYTDYEKFDANGIVLNLVLSNGESGTVSYGKHADTLLTFVPSADKPLTVDTHEVAAEFMGTAFRHIPVSVDHSWTSAPVQISSKVGGETSGYGFHAVVCEGCGETHNAEPCVPDDNWVSNNDATFTADGTERCHCSVCGGTLTRIAYGSAGYNTTFGNFHFLRVIFDYIAVLLRGLKIVTF